MHGLSNFQLSPEIIFFVFLPALIFESAFNLDSRQLIKNILPIVTLAIPALLISTAGVALLLYFLTPIKVRLDLTTTKRYRYDFTKKIGRSFSLALT